MRTNNYAFKSLENQGYNAALQVIHLDNLVARPSRGNTEIKDYRRTGEKAILRTVKSLENQGFDITQHVMQVQKLVARPSRGNTEIKDYELSRFACHLVAMNADPSKKMVAMVDGYFAIKTREADIIKMCPCGGVRSSQH